VKGDAILVSHPSFGYFCEEYGLKQIAIECEGKAPLIKDLSKLNAEIEKSNVQAVLIQTQFNNKGALHFARELGIRPKAVDPLARDYFRNLEEIAEAIIK